MVVSLSASPGKTRYHMLEGKIYGKVFSTDVSDGKLDKLLALNEFLLSKDGWDLTYWGIKDTDYKVNGGRSYTRISNGAIDALYPNASIRYWASWGADFDMIDNPLFSAETKKIGMDLRLQINEGAENGLKKADLFVGGINTPEKSLFTFDY
jgi:hypothetical protein